MNQLLETLFHLFLLALAVVYTLAVRSEYRALKRKEAYQVKTTLQEKLNKFLVSRYGAALWSIALFSLPDWLPESKTSTLELTLNVLAMGVLSLVVYGYEGQKYRRGKLIFWVIACIGVSLL